MKISDVMTPSCTYCNSTDTIAKAAQYMAEQDIGFVPIAHENRLIGTLTDRDIVVRGLASGKDVNATPVAELMSPSVYYCFDDQECDEVAANMGEVQVHRLPVLNREKQLVGMVSTGDLSRGGEAHSAEQALAGISRAA